MPQYVYECECCYDKVELLRKMDDRNQCPICKKCDRPMGRLLSPSAIKVNGYNASNGYSSNKAVKGD